MDKTIKQIILSNMQEFIDENASIDRAFRLGILREYLEEEHKEEQDESNSEPK